MKNKLLIALSLAMISAMMLTSLAIADQIVNNIDTTIDSALESRTITVGGSTVVGFFVQPVTGAGDANGCNATGAAPATVNLSVPSGVSASTSSILFTGCGVVQNVTFSSNTAGSYTIAIASVSGGKSGSLWDTAPASFTLVVNPPANTAPSVIVIGVTDGATYEYGAVPSAVCSLTDAEDGNSTFAATLSVITGPLSAYGLGSQTASCFYTDSGGLTASASATFSVVDTTAPVVTFVGRTVANANGWNNTDVTLNWSCSDSVGIVSAAVSQTLSAEGANQSATGTCQDVAGNTASDTQTGINIDKTAPIASASASPAANANGWNNTAVTVSFSGTDALSGVDFCDPAVLLNSEGSGQSASGTCTDKAGNVSALATASGINIDKTAPTVALIGGPADGGVYYFGFVPAAPTCSAGDALSGIDGSCTVSGYSDAVGSHTLTASATDNAGNSASASASYVVLSWTLKGFYQPVDMSGIFNLIKGGSTVPLKFEVFAGPTELTLTSVVKSFFQTKVQCDGTAPLDDVELTTTGGTSLRYDTTAGQFIQNWQTPKSPGMCYKVTLTTQDGSSLAAFFRLK